MQTYKTEIIAWKIGMETCKTETRRWNFETRMWKFHERAWKTGCMDEILKDIGEILKDNDVKMNILCVTFSMCYAPHLKL